MGQGGIRILTIGHSYVVALNRTFLREVAADPDCKVTVVAPRAFHSELGTIECQPEPQDSPLELVQIDTHWDRWIHAFGYDQKSLRTLVRCDSFDVVHAWEEPYIYAGYQIARIVIECTPRSAYCFRTAQSLPKRYPPPLSYFERTCLRRADGWIAGAQLVYENCLKRGYSSELGRVLTLAVDTSSFRPLPEERRESVRSGLGLSFPVLGYVGRLTAAKGVDVLMRAMELLDPSRQWSLLLLGSGPRETEVAAWAKRNGWSNRVCVRLVPHDEVPRYLGSMDLLLAPSMTTRGWREQFGRMVIEAFACGVPVVASDSGELPHLVGDAGWIVPEGRPEALADAVTIALDRPAERAEMARRGIARADRFSAESVGAQFREYYRELAARRSATNRAA